VTAQHSHRATRHVMPSSSAWSWTTTRSAGDATTCEAASSASSLRRWTSGYDYELNLVRRQFDVYTTRGILGSVRADRRPRLRLGLSCCVAYPVSGSTFHC
jgi:hypothetical protein